MTHLDPAAIPGLNRADAILQHSGYTATLNLDIGRYIVISDDGRDRQELTTLQLMDLANVLEPKTNEGQ